MSDFDRTKPPPERDRDAPELDEPPSEDELFAAERLRRLLERGPAAAPSDPEGELAQSIRAAIAPGALSAAQNQRMVDAALAAEPRGKVLYLAFGGVASLAAMAAAVALVVQQSPREAARISEGSMTLSRSAADLFPEGIPVTGGTSARVERIADARAQDWRENRFARWGVR